MSTDVPSRPAFAALALLEGPVQGLSGRYVLPAAPDRRNARIGRSTGFKHCSSAEEGFGYFTIAPLIAAGDTGAALAALNAPGWVGWVCMGFGIAGLLFLARQFAIRGVRYTRDLYEIRAFCFYPWIIGTAVSVALSAAFLAFTPGTSLGGAVVIMIGSASLGVFAPMAMMFWQKVTTPKDLLDLGVPRAGIAAAVVLAVGNLFVLARGVHFG